MLYAGLDIHKRVVQAVIVDSNGKVVRRDRFDCTREELEKFAKRRLGRQATIAVEATTNTWAVVGVLEPLVKEVVVSNPIRTRAIAEARVKTDKVDAEVLAQLLRAKFLPTVWKPDAATRVRRRTTTQRSVLVSDRTRVKNRIHSVLHQRMIASPFPSLFSTKGREWLANLRVGDAEGDATLASGLRLLASIEKELEAVVDQLAIDGFDEPRVRLLMTLPGVDVAVAQTLLGAIGEASRFKSANHAAAYLGLVPSTRQSAEHCYHGPITKQGSGHARWILIQAAQCMAVQPGPLGVFFRRLAAKKNRNVAVVATARKMVTIAWHMLTNNEPYRYAEAKPVRDKLARHRVRATGEKRVGGPITGAGRHPNWGTGKRERHHPSLDEVYALEGLPPRLPFSEGEQGMLRRKKLVAVLAKVQERRVVVLPEPGTPPKKSGRKALVLAPRVRSKENRNG